MNDHDEDEEQGGLSVFWAIAAIVCMFGILAWSGSVIW